MVLALKRNFEEPEICWQKAMSIKKAFQVELFNNNYILERSKTFVSEEYYGLFISLMDIKPQISIRKEGPEITSKESLKFLKQYTKHVDVVAGPFIDNDRWVIHFTKKGQSVFEFLENLIEKNTFVLNVDSFLKIEIKEKMKIFLANEEIKKIYDRDDTFAENFFLFIERKPLWICNLRDTEV
jgi:tRNA nucleotidyltransferase (CCA-adding enzyme)